MEGLTNLEELKNELINDLEEKQDNKILEPTNVELLTKLIRNADNITEAMAIAELGTTYKSTGFHFDKRLEKIGDTIKYLEKNENLSFVNDENKLTHKLIIGDNYDALLNLLITHKGRIDVIYIDPPYGKNSMGEFAMTNYTNSLTRDNLLSMLYPRLLLSRQLLSDDGVILISIDSKNYSYVKCLMDEIYGENNCAGEFIWVNSVTNQSKYINIEHEYILVYCKKISFHDKWEIYRNEELINYIYSEINKCLSIEDKYRRLKQIIEEKTKDKNLTWLKNYNNISEDGRIYYAQDVSVPGKSNRIVMENGTILEPLANRAWPSKERLDMLDNEKRLVYKGNRPYNIKYLEESKDNIHSLIYNIFTRNGKEMLKSIFNTDKPAFEFPKPTQLLEKILSIFKKDAIVLDFFAGSGTTGQAVLELNKKDGGTRQFIICTNNEITDLTPNGIVYDVTTKRLKRTMTGECYDGTNDFKWVKENEPYGDNLEVFEISEVSNREQRSGKTAFDVIDETNYGLKKFESLEEKITWICSNFDKTQKYIEGE